MATCWLLWFWLRSCGTHTPDFFNFAHWMRWWNGHSSSHLPVLEYTDVDHCWLICLNYCTFIKPRGSSWMWSITNIKTILLKMGKPFSCRLLFDGIVPIHGANVSGRLPLLSPLYWTQRKSYVGNVPISPLGAPFSSIHSSTHYLQMTKHQYVNSSSTIELQIKNDNR